ncbi:hypothetical protein SAZ11_02445 [Streptomyces sp. FXJ1.4098]|nr:hypothetical protein [Streptomyces sp. FXJ1.4098]
MACGGCVDTCPTGAITEPGPGRGLTSAHRPTAPVRTPPVRHAATAVSAARWTSSPATARSRRSCPPGTAPSTTGTHV